MPVSGGMLVSGGEIVSGVASDIVTQVSGEASLPPSGSVVCEVPQALRAAAATEACAMRRK